MSNLNATILKSAICRTRVRPRPIPSLFFFPGLSSQAVYKESPALSRHTDILKSNWKEILKEYQSLRLSTTSPTQKSDYSLVDDEHKLHEGGWDWNSYIAKGKRQSDFASRCPKTVDVLESLKAPSLMTQTPFSYAFFSTLAPGAKIAAHTGPCNLRIRCHLPLVVPEGDCGMSVGGETIKWEEGNPLFFDDCYEHHVWNNTSQERVVLLLDIWHPELHDDEIEAIMEMFEHAKQQGWLKS